MTDDRNKALYVLTWQIAIAPVVSVDRPVVCSTASFTSEQRGETTFRLEHLPRPPLTYIRLRPCRLRYFSDVEPDRN